jgi:hypothetical protein
MFYVVCENLAIALGAGVANDEQGQTLLHQ